MKHLIGKTIETSIVESGIKYTIVVDRYFTVEIVNCDRNMFEVTISPTGQSNVVIVDCVEFDTLFEALQNADEIIGELIDGKIDELRVHAKQAAADEDEGKLRRILREISDLAYRLEPVR